MKTFWKIHPAGQSDPLILIAILLLLAGGLGGAYLVLAEDGGAETEAKEKPSTEKNEKKSPKKNKKPAKKKHEEQVAQVTTDAMPRARRSGWVPSGASEATSYASLKTKATPRRHCEEQSSLIGEAKSMAMDVERVLREETAMSVREETEIGHRLERVFPDMTGMGNRWNRSGDRKKYLAYVESVLNHLLKYTPNLRGFSYRMNILNDENFNAGALPGGVLMIHTGLLDGPHAVQSEAELACVLGHEIAHVELRHCIAKYQYVKAIFGETDDMLAILPHILKTPISSEQEHEADRLGLEIVAAAQYNPMACSQLWERMARLEGGASQDEPEGLLEFGLTVVTEALETVVSTHPPAAHRCHRLEAHVGAAQKKAPFERYYDGKTNLRRRTIGTKQTY